ncbi:FixH family protein [Chitinibacter sp. S2-10]|uniref:FixH family protein n=1 Tax=Chitinibacter sp. S2-10 TaxID=3373597 RepID=UPI003977CC45
MNKPWYKHAHVWLLILFPALAIVGGINMIYLVNTNQDGLVSDSYYKDGQKINERLALDRHANAIGIHAQVLLGENQQNLRIMLNQNIQGELRLKLSHPTRVGIDQQIKLKAISPMMYEGVLPQRLALERWQIELTDEKSSWRLVKEWQVLPDEPVQISPLK